MSAVNSPACRFEAVTSPARRRRRSRGRRPSGGRRPCGGADRGARDHAQAQDAAGDLARELRQYVGCGLDRERLGARLVDLEVAERRELHAGEPADVAALARSAGRGSGGGRGGRCRGRRRAVEPPVVVPVAQPASATAITIETADRQRRMVQGRATGTGASRVVSPSFTQGNHGPDAGEFAAWLLIGDRLHLGIVIHLEKWCACDRCASEGLPTE